MEREMRVDAVSALRWLAVGLAVSIAGCHDEGAVCDDVPGFRPAELLVEDPAAVEFGAGRLAVLWNVLDPATQRSTVNVRFHDLDGAPVGSAIELPGVTDPFSAGGVQLSDATWGFLWPREQPAGSFSIQLAERSDDGGPLGEERTWVSLDGAAFVLSMVRFSSGIAAVWTVDGELSLGIDAGAGVLVTPLGAGRTASLISGGTELGLIWADAAAQVWFRRISASGEPLGEPLAVAPLADYLAPAGCWDGTGYAIAYTVRPSGAGDVHLVRIAGEEIGEPVLLSDGSGGSWAPAIACDDRGYGVAWQRNLESTVPGTDLLVSRIEMVTLSADVEIATAPRAVQPAVDSISMLPRIASDPAGGYRVSWTEYGADGYRQYLSAIDSCDL